MRKRLFGKMKMRRSLKGHTLNVFKKLVEEEPQLYVDEMQELLCANTGVLVSLPTISRVLSQDMNWSRTKHFPIARERDELLRAQYARTLNALEDPSVLLFLDESHQNKEDTRRRWIWGPRGEDNSFREFFKTEKIIMYASCLRRYKWFCDRCMRNSLHAQRQR